MARDDIPYSPTSNDNAAPIVVLTPMPATHAYPTPQSRSTFAHLSFGGARGFILGSILPFLIVFIGMRVLLAIVNWYWSESAIFTVMYCTWVLGATYLIPAALVLLEPVSRLFKTIWIAAVGLHVLISIGVLGLWIYACIYAASIVLLLVFWVPPAVIAFVLLSVLSIHRLNNPTPNEYQPYPLELSYDEIKRQRSSAVVCCVISNFAFIIGMMIMAGILVQHFIAESGVASILAVIVLIATISTLVAFILLPNQLLPQVALAIISICMTASILSATLEILVPFVISIIFFWVPIVTLLLSIIAYIPLATAIRFRDRVRQLGTLGQDQDLPTAIPMGVIGSPTYLQPI